LRKIPQGSDVRARAGEKFCRRSWKNRRMGTRKPWSVRGAWYSSGMSDSERARYFQGMAIGSFIGGFFGRPLWELLLYVAQRVCA
jgi:hypothetical protein